MLFFKNNTFFNVRITHLCVKITYFKCVEIWPTKICANLTHHFSLCGTGGGGVANSPRNDFNSDNHYDKFKVLIFKIKILRQLN